MGSPLCEVILSAPVPEGFGRMEMSHYVGKDDPVRHLQWFEDMVSIRPMTDAFKCRLFAVTLKEKAREWFHQLPAGSIYAFEDLRRGFLLRFSTSRKKKKDAEALFKIKQESEESLAHYLERFREEVLLVEEVPGYTLKLAFTLGLREGFFKMDLKRRAPLSFEELMERVAEEVECEEANPEFTRRLAKLSEPETRQQGGRLKAPKRKFDQEEDNFQEEETDLPGWRQGSREPSPPPQQTMAIGWGRRRRARKAERRGKRRDAAKLPYCDFHEEEGHTTSTCPEFLELREARGPRQQPQQPEEVEEDQTWE